ncbi:MAG: glycosyltransferase, partial [Anaerolineae bacterium]|nr:glycosyltransferase [Anaerolineae bacterium]
RLAVFSHKPCWSSSASPSGYATDGGFPFQMRALSELFDATTLVVLCSSQKNHAGEIPLQGYNLSVAPLTTPAGSGIWRKAALPFWLIGNSPVLVREIFRADAVHTPIPGDIGTIGMLLAFVLRKPLFVRHCNNWFLQRTTAERFWKWFMERFAGGRNVMLTTGGAPEPPSPRNPAIRWIFSTSLTEPELKACLSRRDQSSPKRARIIIVCRQEKGKGIEVVIESLPLLLKDFPEATLDVVGDGSSLTELKRLATKLGVSDRAAFHGKVDHTRVMHLLQQAEVFCFPTASEGFPKVVLEAMACGLPVVTTRVSVLPQLIGNGSGILIEEATPDAVAQAVLRCLADAKRYHAMSAQAIETAKQYSLEQWRNTIGDLLQKAWGPLRSGD